MGQRDVRRGWTSGAALAVAVLAGCAPPPGSAPVLGEGRLRGGDAVRAVETEGRLGDRVLGLTLGQSRACSGGYPAPSLAQPVRTTALSCSGGVSGTATVRPDLLRGRVVVFELATGERGRARL